MSEETPGIRNKKLLIVAILLGVFVAALNVWNINRVREESRPRTTYVLKLRNNLATGDKIVRDDLDVVPIETKYAASLGKVMEKKNLEYALGKKVNQYVEKGWLLQWTHIGGESGRQLYKPAIGMVHHTLEIDSRRAPGTLLQIGDRVNIVTILPDAKRKVRALTVIEGVKVLGIGQRTDIGGDPSSYRRRAMRSYSQIAVEVSPEVARKIANVVTHRRGEVWIDVVSPEDEFTDNPRIHKDVEHLSNAAASE